MAKKSQKQRKTSPPWSNLALTALIIVVIISELDQVDSFQSSLLLTYQQRHSVSATHRRHSVIRGKKRDHNDDHKEGSRPHPVLFPQVQLQDLPRHAVAASLALIISICAITSPTSAVSDDALLAPTPQTKTASGASAAEATASAPEETNSAFRAGMSARRYWSIMANNIDEDAQEMKLRANEALLDHAVGTINTMYYDNSGGAYFTPREFYNKWRDFRDQARNCYGHNNNNNNKPTLATREGAVQGLKYLVSTLNDPYSKYLTREELWQELHSRNDGFLGVGALVEPPEAGDRFFKRGSAPTLAMVIPDDSTPNNNKKKPFFLNKLPSMAAHNSKDPYMKHHKQEPQLSAMQVQSLPVVTAVVPDSPAERSGVTVGDRIVAVGDYSFLGQSRVDVSKNFNRRFATGENYFGHSEVTVAKPVFRSLVASVNSNNGGGESSTTATSPSKSSPEREVVIGYRQTRVRLPTKSLEDEFQTASSTIKQSSPTPQAKQQRQKTVQVPETQYALASATNIMPSASPSLPDALTKTPPTKGGNSIVHWELISEQSTPSIFQRSLSDEDSATSSLSSTTKRSNKVGYIRLTRFSRASTAGYIEAVQSLEQAGAKSYIIDVRNNYGGIIQEAMLTASTLIRDPHAVLCYTLNARGGFTPHDVEEYVVDKRYSGYLLTKEPRWVTLKQVHQEAPGMFEENGNQWVPPSSYASLHEQTTKRGIHRVSFSSDYDSDDNSAASPMQQWNTAAGSRVSSNRNQQWLAQKNIVILVNEGTASAAEVFASSLHDNGRTLALIGSKTYGKGLIQHTFPMPDGGGLRLTVAEYLTPALHHVTNVGNARFDPVTGEQVGGGIRPDLSCDSRQGIPSNIGADLCVGMALDVLEEAMPEDNSPGPSRQIPYHDWTTPQKGLFVKDGSVGSSTLSASSSVSPGEEAMRPVADKEMEAEF